MELSKLVGKNKIKEEFVNLCKKKPWIIKCIPCLLAVRNTNISGINFKFDFNDFNLSQKRIEELTYFMEQTGLFKLLNHNINNLFDYLLGVEVGLNSNARKNRTGKLMEDLVEDYIKKAGFIKDQTYFKQINLIKLFEKFNNKENYYKKELDFNKRFDFAIKTSKNLYVCECNFYSQPGSKPNEVARSYLLLAKQYENISNIKFVWFTDGIGWISSKNILKNTFLNVRHIYSIDDLENGVLKTL